MKLYYKKGACSLVPRIVLNELGLRFDEEPVDLANKKTESGKDYFSINAKGSVPAFITDTNEVITEAAVILQYLADYYDAAHALLPPVKHMGRYKVLEWLNFMATDMHKGIGIFYNPNLSEEAKEKVFLPLLRKRLDVIDPHLSKQTYLAGESFTLPDAYFFVMLTWTQYIKFDLKQWAHVCRYFDHLFKRASIQKSLEQEGLTTAVAQLAS